MMTQFFVTGTCTGVGKTSYSVDRIRSWRAKGVTGVGLKPFATGDRGDAIRLQEAMEGELSLDEINPCCFASPMAPLMAAQKEGRGIPYDLILKHTVSLAEQFSHLVVEGAGGWMVPLTEEKMICDFAKELGFPVVIVGRAGLGTINQTLLTVEAVNRHGLGIQEIVLNRFPEDSEELANLNRDFLAQRTGAAVRLAQFMQ